MALILTNPDRERKSKSFSALTTELSKLQGIQEILMFGLQNHLAMSQQAAMALGKCAEMLGILKEIKPEPGLEDQYKAMITQLVKTRFSHN